MQALLRKLIQFEFRYHSRQISFYAALLVFFSFGLLLGSQNPAGSNVHTNSPYNVTHGLGLLSLFSIFVLTVFCTNAMLRDTNYKMAEIVYSSPVGKFRFLFGRFTGCFLAAFVVIGVAVIGMLSAGLTPWVDPEELRAFRFTAYLWPLMVLVAPNLLFAGSLLFAIAALTRNALATYLGGLSTYCFYFIAAMLLNSPLIAGSTPASAEGLALAALLDPFGITGFMEQTRYWTALERNTQLVSLSGNFLLNRVLWVSFAILIFALANKLFSFKFYSQSKKSENAAREEARSAPRYSPVLISERKTAWQWQAFLATTKLEVRSVVKSLPFLGILLLWASVVVSEIFSGVASGNYGSPSLPVTSLIVSLIQDPLPKIGTLILIFYSADIVWRERGVQLHEIVDTTPAPNVMFFGSKYVALALVVCILIATSIVLGLLYQATHGFFDFDLAVYLSMFYFNGLPLLLLAVVALWIQSLAPNRYLGMLLMLIFYLAIHGGTFTGIQHNLLRFANAPEVVYSEMNGFGHFTRPFHWFMVYWSAVAGLLALVAYCLWRRGTDVGLRHRLRQLPRQWGKTGRVVAGLCLFLLVASGSHIFYNTNILNAHEISEERLDWRAEYEKEYKQYETLAQPQVVGVKTVVDLFPEARRYTVRGNYSLQNKTEGPIEKVLISVRRDVRLTELALSDAELIGQNERFGKYWFKLQKPLQPKDESRLQLDVEISNPGFVNSRPDNSIVENGSFLLFTRFLPRFGYRESYEIRNPKQRRKRDLPELKHAPEDELEHGTNFERTFSLVDFETTISTSNDQIALAPGYLEREWQQNGRRYFHYKMDQPSIPFFAYMSARYEVARSRHQGVNIEIYHHPQHRYNVDRMIQATRLALDYCSQNFSPYEDEQMRIFEIPAYWSFFSGVGFRNTVGFLENRGFLADVRDPNSMDLVLRRTAHEIAHQWWGHQLKIANAPGGGVLTESLTKYTELMVLEKQYGPAFVRRFVAYELDRYLRGRTRESDEERPLYLSERQPHLDYSKGMLVMFAMKELLGEDAVNRALRSLLKQRLSASGVTTLDLLNNLYEVAPRKHHDLIDDWMKRIVFYDLKVESASYRPLAAGRYQVTMSVSIAKNEANGAGEETPMPINESFEVGVFTEHPDDATGVGHVLYLKQHYFEQEIAELSMVVDKQPRYVGIDPNIRLIDKNRFDNLRGVEQLEGPSK